MKRPSWYRIAFHHSCPACGKASIYQGVLAIKPACEKCKLDFSRYPADDGPAFFVMMLVPVFLVLIGLPIYQMVTMPLWGHLLLVGVCAIILSLYGLRIAKSVMLAIQYFHDIKE